MPIVVAVRGRVFAGVGVFCPSIGRFLFLRWRSRCVVGVVGVVCVVVLGSFALRMWGVVRWLRVGIWGLWLRAGALLAGWWCRYLVGLCV